MPPGTPTAISWSGKYLDMFGLTEEQIAQWGLTFGVGGFILYMVFIIVQLARESKAGKFGTFVLFLVLGFGLLGFVAKNIIAWLLNI
jgi:Protein of unknown function (DUF2788)